MITITIVIGAEGPGRHPEGADHQGPGERCDPEVPEERDDLPEARQQRETTNRQQCNETNYNTYIKQQTIKPKNNEAR